MRTLVLDSGAFIASEKKRRAIAGYVAEAEEQGRPIVAPAAVIAEAWREPAAYAITFLLASVDEVEPLNLVRAKNVGAIISKSGNRQIADASVAETAVRLRPSLVLTSDPDDISSIIKSIGYTVAEHAPKDSADVVVIGI